MEASSPLAALRPSSFHMPPWGRSELYTARPHSHMPTTFGPGSLNFRDISMNKPARPDYFSMKPVRGSSPTASLAADLSQNFHIDMSPQLPTPRRSLFTSNLFGTFAGRTSATTPPLPSSSPGPMNEMMDISPLPHKQPYFAQVDAQSPTPVSQSSDQMQSSPPRSAFLEAPRPPMERRKSILPRPSLARMKGYSTSAVPRNTDNQLPPFKFGAGSSKLSTSTSMSLGECFLESPPRERRPQSANSPSASVMAGRANKPSGSFSSNNFRNGWPCHSRRPSNPLVRSRKQFRRSLSMFEHPGDIMKPKKDETQPSTLNTVMDADELHQPILPHFFQEGNPDSIPRITKQTLLDVLDGRYLGHFGSHMVVDCRFEYEFEGGHINGAVNYNDKEMFTRQLFEMVPSGKTLLIFHCEYSAHRAPIMARHVRKQDRTANVEYYPRLTFPDIYILDGGYSSFFTEHRVRCFPQNYVEMDAKEHAYTCEREMGKLRQNRTKLTRAQTFAFGSHQMDESPTAPARVKTMEIDLSMMDSSPIPAFDRAFPKRLVSY